MPLAPQRRGGLANKTRRKRGAGVKWGGGRCRRHADAVGLVAFAVCLLPRRLPTGQVGGEYPLDPSVTLGHRSRYAVRMRKPLMSPVSGGNHRLSYVRRLCLGKSFCRATAESVVHRLSDCSACFLTLRTRNMCVSAVDQQAKSVLDRFFDKVH